MPQSGPRDALASVDITNADGGAIAAAMSMIASLISILIPIVIVIVILILIHIVLLFLSIVSISPALSFDSFLLIFTPQYITITVVTTCETRCVLDTVFRKRFSVFVDVGIAPALFVQEVKSCAQQPTLFLCGMVWGASESIHVLIKALASELWIRLARRARKSVADS